MAVLNTNLRTIREQRGYSLREVARQAGVSPAFLSMLENGYEPKRTSKSEAIAEALGVTSEVLFPSTPGT